MSGFWLFGGFSFFFLCIHDTYIDIIPSALVSVPGGLVCLLPFLVCNSDCTYILFPYTFTCDYIGRKGEDKQ
jgi:hypothetical protein